MDQHITCRYNKYEDDIKKELQKQVHIHTFVVKQYMDAALSFQFRQCLKPKYQNKDQQKHLKPVKLKKCEKHISILSKI